MGPQKGEPELPSGWTREDADLVVEAAAAAWPDLPAPQDDFVRHVAEALADAEQPSNAIETLRVGELYIAHLCAQGDAEAVTAFEKRYDAAIATSVRRVNSQHHSSDDLAQIVRQKLFVGAKPAMHAYSGRGSLAAWVGVVAMRTALNAVRGAHPKEVPLMGDALVELDELSDPQLDYLKNTYRLDFRAAFTAAVDELEARERTILQQHLVEKLTVRELGRMYSVNSGTVSRWITRAREKLAELTCTALQDKLAVTPAELESIMRLVRSCVDLSLTRVFGPSDSED